MKTVKSWERNIEVKVPDHITEYEVSIMEEAALSMKPDITDEHLKQALSNVPWREA